MQAARGGTNPCSKNDCRAEKAHSECKWKGGVSNKLSLIKFLITLIMCYDGYYDPTLKSVTHYLL